jgi:Cu+-exporting ATPase
VKRRKIVSKVELREKFNFDIKIKTMHKTLKIEGMTCGHCKMKVENTLNDLSSVDSAEVDLIDGTCEVELNTDINSDDLNKIIADAGYTLVEIS